MCFRTNWQALALLKVRMLCLRIIKAIIAQANAKQRFLLCNRIIHFGIRSLEKGLYNMIVFLFFQAVLLYLCIKVAYAAMEYCLNGEDNVLNSIYMLCIGIVCNFVLLWILGKSISQTLGAN
jgi:hypothetical protein